MRRRQSSILVSIRCTPYVELSHVLVFVSCLRSIRKPDHINRFRTDLPVDYLITCYSFWYESFTCAVPHFPRRVIAGSWFGYELADQSFALLRLLHGAMRLDVALRLSLLRFCQQEEHFEALRPVSKPSTKYYCLLWPSQSKVRFRRAYYLQMVHPYYTIPDQDTTYICSNRRLDCLR